MRGGRIGCGCRRISSRRGGRRAVPLRRGAGGGHPVHARRAPRGRRLRLRGRPLTAATRLALAGRARSRRESRQSHRAGDDARPPARRERRRHQQRERGGPRRLPRPSRRAGPRDVAGAGDGSRLERRRRARHPHVAGGAAGHRADARLPAARGRAVKGRRRLALGVLLGAALLAVAAFPVRETWWGGWILAVAEAGVVGGLADWFAVTAIFRRPLGLPIPHTALIPHNWELMAERVGVMVGSRVLTKDYVRDELARVDVGELLARGAERVSRADLEKATRLIAGWAAEQMTPATTAELPARGRRLLAAEPVAPLLAAALGVARRQGWDQRLLDGALAVLAGAMERPEFREAVADVVDDLLTRYRERLGMYPRLLMGLAEVVGLLDRERLVTALHTGLREVAKDREHPLRRQAVEVLADLERRLIADAALAARV